MKMLLWNRQVGSRQRQVAFLSYKPLTQLSWDFKKIALWWWQFFLAWVQRISILRPLHVSPTDYQGQC